MRAIHADVKGRYAARMIRGLFVPLFLCMSAVAALAEDEPAPPPEPPAPRLPSPRLIGPRRGEERIRALQRGGGNAATEKTISQALAWLARHQSEDGGWDADGFSEHCEEGKPECTGVGKGQHGEDVPCPFDDAISALATLAFLGRGYLPADAVTEENPYGPRLERALERLRGVGGRWGLPLATQALAEAEVMQGEGRFREDLQRGVERLLAARGEDGAWGYASGFRPGSDIPYCALVVQALVTARDAGAELPADLGERVGTWMKTLEVDKKGRLAYVKDGRRYGYTPTGSNAHCGAAIRELLEIGSDAQQKRLFTLISKQKPVWKISFRDYKVPGRGVVPVQVGNLSMYQWWYGTIATFQSGGSRWSGWFGKVKSALVGHRVKAGCARGSWDPKGTYERQTGGRVFATALGALMLEQPYRHRRLSDKRPSPAEKDR